MQNIVHTYIKFVVFVQILQFKLKNVANNLSNSFPEIVNLQSLIRSFGNVFFFASRSVISSSLDTRTVSIVFVLFSVCVLPKINFSITLFWITIIY